MKPEGKLNKWPDDAEAPCSLVSSELSARRTLSGKGIILFVELRTVCPLSMSRSAMSLDHFCIDDFEGSVGGMAMR